MAPLPEIQKTSILPVAWLDSAICGVYRTLPELRVWQILLEVWRCGKRRPRTGAGPPHRKLSQMPEYGGRQVLLAVWCCANPGRAAAGKQGLTSSTFHRLAFLKR